MNTNAFDQVPGEAMLQQKLRLFAFLAIHLFEGLHCIPIDFVQACEIVVVLEVA